MLNRKTTNMYKIKVKRQKNKTQHVAILKMPNNFCEVTFYCGCISNFHVQQILLLKCKKIPYPVIIRDKLELINKKLKLKYSFENLRKGNGRSTQRKTSEKVQLLYKRICIDK